jgi:DNA-binding NtrC family response regulator
MPARILVIDQGDPSVASVCLRILADQVRCETRTWDSVSQASLAYADVHLLLAHAVPNPGKAVLLFQWLGKNPIQIPVLAILPEHPDAALMQAVSEAADDFLFCPLRDQELKLRMSRILEVQTATREQIRLVLGDELGRRQLVGEAPAFLQAAEQVRLFGASEAPVLISGETGTGKELFAHAIHSLCSRRSGPFIPVDCGTLPEALAENELFGHCRGAFTDAHANQKGLAGMAEGGTLFLDEVDALSLATQSKLLRFLQEGSYRPLGAERFTRANVRIIAATNRSIEDCVRRNEFRSDLYFRLNVLRLDLPPLRIRRGDIPLLAAYFVENECAVGGAERKVLSVAALRKLESYHWPGNVRELLNTVQRAFVCCPGNQILPIHISLPNRVTDPLDGNGVQEDFRTAKQHLVESFERAYIEELMARHQGNITQAAREAGKERRAFGRLAKKYGLPGQGVDAGRGAGHSRPIRAGRS